MEFKKSNEKQRDRQRAVVSFDSFATLKREEPNGINSNMSIDEIANYMSDRLIENIRRQFSEASEKLRKQDSIA